jgi:hypothetical protein
MISEPTTVAVIALSGVIISAILSALIAFVTSRKALYVNAVTVERSKWIEKLRNNIATYSAAAHGLFYKAKTEDWEKGASPEYFAQLRQLQDLKSQLKLRLNPRGEIDANIIKLVDRLYHLARKWTVGLELEVTEHLLIEHAQWLLKAEWEKVKTEARGPLSHLIAKRRERRHLAEYREVAKGHGSFLVPISN